MKFLVCAICSPGRKQNPSPLEDGAARLFPLGWQHCYAIDPRNPCYRSEYLQPVRCYRGTLRWRALRHLKRPPRPTRVDIPRAHAPADRCCPFSPVLLFFLSFCLFRDARSLDSFGSDWVGRRDTVFSPRKKPRYDSCHFGTVLILIISGVHCCW